MSNLFLLLHAAQEVAPLYRLSLPPDWDVHTWVEPGAALSSGWVALARRLATKSAAGAAPRILPGLVEHVGLGAGALDRYGRVVIATWSAAYALMELLLAVPVDANRIDGWVALDSGYASVDPAIVDYARLARDGRRLYFAGYTDVPTYGYASSGGYLAEVRRQAGAEQELFSTEHWAHDPSALALAGAAGADAVRRFWEAEHTGALRVHGPALAARAIAALENAGSTAPMVPIRPPVADPGGDPPGGDPTLREGDRCPAVRAWQLVLAQAGHAPRGGADGVFGPATAAATRALQEAEGLRPDGVVDAETWARARTAGARETQPDSRDPAAPVDTGSFAEKALAVALAELAEGVREDAGRPNRGARVDEYTGPVGAIGQPWCAAFEGWCRERAGRLAPLGRHAAVAELWAAALRTGHAHAVGSYAPKRGDRAIFRRLVDGHWGDPRLGQNGHVGAIEVPPGPGGGDWTTIDGNHEDRVARVERHGLDEVVGWIEVV